MIFSEPEQMDGWTLKVKGLQKLCDSLGTLTSHLQKPTRSPDSSPAAAAQELASFVFCSSLDWFWDFPLNWFLQDVALPPVAGPRPEAGFISS